MKNSIRILMILSIVLLLSCGKADSGSATNAGSLINQDYQARDVVLTKKAENKLQISWTAPVEAERVDYYLVELRSEDTVINRRASAEETKLEFAVQSGRYRASVAVVAEGIAESGVAGNQEQSVETKATVPGDVGITAQDLSTAMSSVEHARIGVKWQAPAEFGKMHSGADAEPMAYILYWKKGTELGTIDYEGTLTVEKDATTGVPATNANIETLAPGTDYAVRVVVENAAGLRSEGVALTIKTAESQATAPSAPVIQVASIVSIGTESDATLSFSWTEPASQGTDHKGNKAVINEYRIYWEEGGSVSAATGELLTLSKNTTTASIVGLKNEVEYTFMVVVVTNDGLSTESVAQSYTTAAKTVIKKTDISGSTLSYDSNVDIREGQSKTVPIRNSNIPEEANPVYVLTPVIAGVEIESDTGSITTVGANLGTYKFTVVATVVEDDPAYTGTVSSNQITLRVQKSDIVYKPLSEESRNIFTAGDADNPWLFVIENLDQAISVTEVSADITITEQGSSIVLYAQRDIPVDSFEHEGETVVGFGPSASAGSWSAITAMALRLEVLVLSGEKDIDYLALNVEKGVAGDIYSWWDLQKMNEDLTKNYVIQNDIDFPKAGTYNFPEAGFIPIGKDSTKGNAGHQGTAFSGSLDGGGHSIRGLVVNDAELDYAGLFGQIKAGAASTKVVKDLVITDPLINANAMAGVVAGYLSTGTIENVVVRSTADTSGVWADGTVKEIGIGGNPSGYTGGLVGALRLGEILQCSSEVLVTGTGSFAGGLVGSNKGTKVMGHATGAVSGTDNVGGLVGWNAGTVTGYATGAVSGTGNYVGGLMGRNVGGTVTGYVTGNVSGTGEYVGGLVGYNEDNGAITGYVTGNVLGNGGHAGGLVGYIKNGEATGYMTGNVSGSGNYIGGLAGWNHGIVIVGYMRGTVTRNEGTDANYGLLFGLGVGKGYYSFAESSIIGISKDAVSGFSGSPLPMKEETKKASFKLLDFINGSWRWVADGQWPAIDIGSLKPANEQPTERSDKEFPEDSCVTVEDNRPEYKDEVYLIDSWQELQWMENCLYANYKLTDNITFPEPGKEGVPQDGFTPVGNNVNKFTGNFDGGGYSISGLSIARSESDYVGLFGYVYGGRVANLHIEHSGIQGKEYVGAVAGFVMTAEIEGVSMESTKKVSGIQHVGGLVGRNNGTVIGYATGEVSAIHLVGGLVGGNFGTIIGYAKGDVSGTAALGALTGYNGVAGTVIGYSTGTVLKDSNSIGGLISLNDGTAIGYWIRGTMNWGDTEEGISSTENIYYFTDESETTGREQYNFYDKGTGNDPNIRDAEDTQIFNNVNFTSIFELPNADKLWPKLKQSFTVESRAITLIDAIYNAQENVVGWTTTETE